MKRIEILIRRLLLNLLLFITKKPKTIDIGSIPAGANILFIRLNRIGDALVSSPLLHFIKNNSDFKISVLVSTSNYFIFSDAGICDEVIVYDKKKSSLYSLIKHLKSKNFSVVVDLHDDVSSTVSYIIAFMNSRFKFALKKGTDKLYTHTIEKLDPSKHHVVDRIMEFSKLFGYKFNKEQINIFYTPKQQSISKAEIFLNNHFSRNKFLLGINISAGSEARFWGENNFISILNSLEGYDVNILILCVEKDISKATAIAGTKYPVYYTSDFNQFSAMISKLNFLFTPDTSIVHVASAFEIPVFGLYVKFNTNDMIWSPYKSPFDCVITAEPNLKNVTFETVKEKFFPFFEKFYYEHISKPDY